MLTDEFDPDELVESSRESVAKVRDLVNDLRSIEEHEKNVLEKPKQDIAATV